MSKQTGFSFASSKKSLIETIDEIKKSKMPRNEKIVALKACGLREKEISDMLKVCVPSGSTSTRFVYTFGVEIECVHAERNALTNDTLSQLGTSVKGRLGDDKWASRILAKIR